MSDGDGNGLLRMRELAQRSGVSAGTIKHYVREGLLGGDEGIVRTSRNMAYYPPELVERIRLIKRLQEERFMPLRAIRALLDDDPDRAGTLVELEDRILERALARDERRVSAAEVKRRYEMPAEVRSRSAHADRPPRACLSRARASSRPADRARGRSGARCR